MRTTSIANGVSPEPLEARIAPATVTITYVDVDGDFVRITASKPGPTAPPLTTDDLLFTDGDPDGQLKTLTLTDVGFDGARITFSVIKRIGGDGRAHIGFIDATGVDLNTVVVKGDLGKIIAGDSITTDDPGLDMLQVRTMGNLGTITQGGLADLDSIITGKLGALKVAGDFTDAHLKVVATTPADGMIGTVSIGNSLIGGPIEKTGAIYAYGSIGSIRVGGNVTGSAGKSSGQITSLEDIGEIRIGGNVVGGAGENSGRIATNGMVDRIKVTGSVVGGAGVRSGLIAVNGLLDFISIGGSIVGGAGHVSGGVLSTSDIANLRIGGDIIGGGVTESATLTYSGFITSSGRIASVTIGGSLIAGQDNSAGELLYCGAILASDNIGPIRIGGSILGSAANPAVISARGQHEKPTSGFDLAIDSLNVVEEVRFATVLAGFDFDYLPPNADASIGRITVGRNWVASNLVAGAYDAGPDGYGVGDTLIDGGDANLIATIASITIKGEVTSSLLSGDHFGFVAQQIDKLKVGTRTYSLAEGSSNAADNFLVSLADDVRLLEVG